MHIELAELHSGDQVQRGVVTDFLPFFLQVVVETTHRCQVAAQETIVFPVAVIVLQAQGGIVVGNAGQAVAIDTQAGGVLGEFALEVAGAEVQSPPGAELGAAF